MEPSQGNCNATAVPLLSPIAPSACWSSIRDGTMYKLMRYIQLLIDANTMNIQLRKEWMPEVTGTPDWVTSSPAFWKNGIDRKVSADYGAGGRDHAAHPAPNESYLAHMLVLIPAAHREEFKATHQLSADVINQATLLQSRNEYSLTRYTSEHTHPLGGPRTDQRLRRASPRRRGEQSSSQPQPQRPS